MSLKGFLTILSATILLAVSCVSDNETLSTSKTGGSDIPSKKIINTPSPDMEISSIMVKLAVNAPTDALSDIQFEGIEGIHPIFTSLPGKENLEKECGLDRWYEVLLNSDCSTPDVMEYVEEISKMEEITLIQYPSKAAKASDCKVYPYNPPKQDNTKANESFFNDPFFQDQWNCLNTGSARIATSAFKGADINVVNVWESLTTGNPDIIVAILDEGVQYNHPDLMGNMWTNLAELHGLNGVDDDRNGYIDDIYGYNFINNTGSISWAMPGDSGHGTHCAGIIAAENNNKIGICGIAGGSGFSDGCRIMSCQIFSGKKSASEAQSAAAFQYAANNGASIASCSWGYSYDDIICDDDFIRNMGVEYDAIRYFEKTRNNKAVDGGLVIFSSGNNGRSTADYPGAMNNIICVSAIGPDGLPAYYINYGAGCNIVAPGGDFLPPATHYRSLILSTIPTTLISQTTGIPGYGYMMGTSMACPHVAGIAALGLSYAQQLGIHLSLNDFKDMLLTSVRDIDSRLEGTKEYYDGSFKKLELNEYKKKLGVGAIDTWLLMMKLEGVPSIIAEVGKESWVDISDYFGTSSTNLTYLDIYISDEDKASLGLVSEPYIQYGRLWIHPTKVSSGKIVVKAVAGGTTVGGGKKKGGKEISQVISVISRNNVSNNGGWL